MYFRFLLIYLDNMFIYLIPRVPRVSADGINVRLSCQDLSLYTSYRPAPTLYMVSSDRPILYKGILRPSYYILNFFYEQVADVHLVISRAINSTNQTPFGLSRSRRGKSYLNISGPGIIHGSWRIDYIISD